MAVCGATQSNGRKKAGLNKPSNKNWAEVVSGGKEFRWGKYFRGPEEDAGPTVAGETRLWKKGGANGGGF